MTDVVALTVSLCLDNVGILVFLHSSLPDVTESRSSVDKWYSATDLARHQSQTSDYILNRSRWRLLIWQPCLAVFVCKSLCLVLLTITTQYLATMLSPVDLSIMPVWSSWRQAVHLGLKITWWAFSQAEVVMRYPDCASERNKPWGCDAIICFFWEKVLPQVWDTAACVWKPVMNKKLLLNYCENLIKVPVAVEATWSKVNKSEPLFIYLSGDCYSTRSATSLTTHRAHRHDSYANVYWANTAKKTIW